MAKNIASVGVDPTGADRALRTGAEIDQLAERINRLELTVDAMWVLLERAGYSSEDLESVVRELDGADGSVDGRRSPKGTPCRSCGAMVDAGRTSCVFCGADVS